MKQLPKVYLRSEGDSLVVYSDEACQRRYTAFQPHHTTRPKKKNQKYIQLQGKKYQLVWLNEQTVTTA